MKFRPLHDRVLIKVLDSDEKTAGGIIIPDSAKEKPQQADIIAVGKGKRADDGSVMALDVQAGDRVLIGKYSGTDISVEDEDLIILREDEILGVLEN